MGGDRTRRSSAAHAAAGKGWAFGCPPVEFIPDRYVLEEFAVSGSAVRYAVDGENATPFNGHWRTRLGDTAPYTTRAYVVRPSRAADFNGVVVLNWQNVTGGFDVGAPVIAEATRGYAWVGLTTQKIGVDGTPAVVPGLPAWDPERYRGLDHPGDAWSYDILTQLGRALKGDAEIRRLMLGGFAAETVLATGASQSAMRLSTYINAVHMHEHAFDGFLLTVHWGICPPLDEVPLMDTLRPEGEGLSAYHAQIRDDLNVPILVVATECEARYNFATRQPDTDTFRFWEVAGASHQSPASVALLRAIMERDAVDIDWPVAERTNTVDWDYVQGAALRSLAGWARTGAVPRRQPRIDMRSNAPDDFERDGHGNVTGGIRVPELEAPIATHRGERGDMTNPAWLEGSIEPFRPERLHQLYPNGRNLQWQRAVDRLVSQGVVLDEDEARLRTRVDGTADASGAGA